jgi:hypothetical protein
MPFLTDREVEAMAREYGFIDSDEEEKVGEKGGEKGAGDLGANNGVEGTRESSGEKAREDTRRSSERTLHMGDTTEHGFRND